MALRRRGLAALATLACCGTAQATLGVYEHGNGIAALGMGGASYSLAYETTAISANPAHALGLGKRFDLGIDGFQPSITGVIRGNAAGPDESDRTVHRTYTVPQGGLALPLSKNLAIGFSLISAGLGPDYPVSPYQRFGGASRAHLVLQSSNVVTALAWQPVPGQTFGIGIGIGYQGFELAGMKFLSAVSAHPDAVSDRGRDGALTYGFNVGWLGQLTPWLTAGIAYRSQNWTQKAQRYAGLLPKGGELNLPAIFGGGLSAKLAPGWIAAVEYQRYQYRDQIAFRNGIQQLEAGNLLGSDNGTGFGFNNQNVLKLGLVWDVSSKLALRAGYIRANQVVQPGQTLFGLLGCVTPTTHYTLGASYRLSSWQLAGFAFDAPHRKVSGVNSIPAAFGGGEADVTGSMTGFGVSLGRTF